MKKILLGLGLLFTSVFAQAQNGLENVIVEKYYVSNAADAAGSVGTLPVGSVTYRIYADLLPGYKFQAAYGIPTHALTFSTTTTFFNNEDRGATTPTYTKTQARSNSVMLDSWLSVGAGCVGNFGILKSEDDVAAGGPTVVNSNSMLQNADPSAGIPLTVQDGLYAGVPEAVTTVGLTAADLGVFDATSQVGGLFSTTNGSWASLNGSLGPIAATNRVLIAQITTDGVFHYELNIQVGTPTGGVQNFVALNPTGSEISLPSLSGTLGAANIPPAVSITAPATGSNFVTGTVINIAANASDADGNITGVEFLVDNVVISTDLTTPYTANYTGTTGAHALTARATDNNGAQTTSAVVNITCASNPAPTVSITAPANGTSFVTGDVVNIAANATDNGSVTGVEFFVDGNLLSTDNTSPYTAVYTSVIGSHVLTARATDNLGLQTTSAAVTINVANNLLPTVSITSPSASATFTAPAVVTINANAADADGSVTLVEFLVNGILVGTDATAPYSFDWTSVIGQAILTARATDNRGATKTSAPVVLQIADANALPYALATVQATCLPASFCLPLLAVDTVKNVIGYDVVLNYNVAKVRPTGLVTVSNDLINASYTDVINSIDSVNGAMYISVFFNVTAPANAKFQGVGQMFCVEFAKKAAFNSVDTAIFSVSSLQESYFNGVTAKLTQSGNYNTYKDSTFNGSLRFWADNSPIRYNELNPAQYLITNIYGNNVTCTSQSVTAVQPDLLGNFRYSILNGVDVNIEKDILNTTDVQPVINGFDAMLTRKVLINDVSFIPNIYQAIAMDVNADGVISAGDVSQINQRAVLMIPEFRQAWNYNSNGVSNGQPSKDWLFIDSVRIATSAAYHLSATYPLNDGIGFSKSSVPVVPFCLPVPVTNASDCPLITLETYKGVLLGDVNGNYATVTPSNLFRLSAENKVVFDLGHAVKGNGFIDVPVAVTATEDVYSLDFALQMNEEKFAFSGINGVISDIQPMANFNADDHTLRVTSNSLEQYPRNMNVMNVRLKTNEASITAADLNSAVGYLNGETVRVELKDASGTEMVNISVYPNPAQNVLYVVSPEDADVVLTDMEGRQVMMQDKAIGGQKLELNTQTMAEGVYLLRVSNKNFVSVNKVVIKK